MSQIVIDGRWVMTQAELEHYRARLADLRRIQHVDLPELLRTARQFVASDTAEEIAQLQDDHAVVEAHIAQLERILRDAQVLDPSAHARDCVLPGRTVTLRYTRTGREVSLTLGEGVPHGVARRASVRSPVGRAVFGRCAGDVVVAELPDGRREQLLILAVGETPASC